MRLNDYKIIFIFASLFLILISCIPFVTSNEQGPRTGQEIFFGLAVLGEEGKAYDYYPDDDPNISAGESVNWKIYLDNHLEETKLVTLKVKILNSTMVPPDSSSCEPSTANVIYETQRIVALNESLIHPFQWSLLEVDENNESISIDGMSINGEPFKAGIKDNRGYFRLVFELWIYDRSVEDDVFGWVSGEKKNCVWNQVWFKVRIS